MCTYKEQYLGASQQVLPIISPIYVSNQSVGAVLEIFSVEKRNGRMKHMKWLKGAKPEGLEEVSVTWLW
jgi:hypothetical protein